jgi:hypothetical protein
MVAHQLKGGGGSWFKAHLGRKIVKLHLKKQAKCGVSAL